MIYRLLLVVCALIVPSLRAQERTFGAILQPYVNDHTLAGAVVLVADPANILRIETAGWADIAAQKPMLEDSLFWIASQSKPITGAALMILVDEGKVDVDDPVEKYLPEFKGQQVKVGEELKSPRHPIRVREILSHTSGLPFKSDLEQPTLDLFPLADRVRSYAILPLLFEPGSKSLYSNAGINTAGRIIEVVSGMSFEKFMEERICKPLGMIDTTFWPSESQLTRLAKAYKPNAAKNGLEECPITQLKYPLNDPERKPMPAGGLFSTAKDLSIFYRMLANKGAFNGTRILSENAVKEMTSDQSGEAKSNYGFGIGTSGAVFTHGGAYNTNSRFDRERNLITIFLVQHAAWGGEGKGILPAVQKAATEAFGSGKAGAGDVHFNVGMSGTSDTITNSIGMKLVTIKPGQFRMGQDGPAADYHMIKHPEKFDDADWDEKPAHEVTITQPFAIGATEVTLGQYRLFKDGFRRNNGADDEAVRGISWYDAVAFCEWLCQKEGKTYRLPTEAEWEYACRAGTTNLYHTGDALPAGFQKWFRDESRRVLYFPGESMPAEYRRIPGIPTVQVGQTLPNAWGLYDMHGNVAEWCADWYGPYEANSQTDPLGRSEGDFRVFRGGWHSSFSRLLRSANRGAWLPGAKDNIGFRVVLGEMPKGNLLNPSPAGLHSQNVSQVVTQIELAPADLPFFAGPKVFVKIPPESSGPLYSWHNHSPTITECPNGDLLAAWFSCVDEGGSELNNLAARLRYGSSEWEAASSFWDGADINDHAPKLWWDGDRTLYHFARGQQENIMRTSTDSGATWSKASLLFPVGEFGNQLIRTREGVMMIPHDSRTVGLVTSRDGGKTWMANTMPEIDPVSVIVPGGVGRRPPGIHAPIVQLADGSILAMSRQDPVEDQARFHGKTPISITRDEGKTWSFAESEFPAISSAQRQAMIRLKEGPILFCSYTDQGRDWKNRKGLPFKAADGSIFMGYGLFAAVSYDEGKTWPDRRVITPGGPGNAMPTIDRGIANFSDTMSEPTGYLAVTQTRDGRIQLLSSKNHYVFNLAWLKQLPPAPGK